LRVTEELFSVEAYARTCEATVTAVTDDGVVLDRTVFYARSGGQPGDTGTLRWEGGEGRVADTVKRGGMLMHVVDDKAPAAGTAVVADIDWDRRHTLMRTHTALHALSAIVFRDYGAKVTGGNMEPGAARMDFELESITPEFGREVEEKLNAELSADRPVKVTFLAREVAKGLTSRPTAARTCAPPARSVRSESRRRRTRARPSSGCASSSSTPEA